MPESPASVEVKLERRGTMISLAMLGGLLISYGTAALYGFRYLFGRQEHGRKIQVLVAALPDVSDGGSLLKEDLSGKIFFLLRSGENIRAFSTTCTHLGCQVHWRPEEKIFFCPCHDGKFDADGNPIAGPPPRPLDQLPVKVRGSSIFVSMAQV